MVPALGKSYKCMIRKDTVSIINLLGRLMLVGKALSFTHELYFFLFLSIYHDQQPCRGWSSNVFRRFGRR